MATDEHPEWSRVTPLRSRADLAWGVVAILFSILLWRAAGLFLLLFAALLFASFLQGISEVLTARTRLSFGWSLPIVLLLLGVLVVGTVWLLAPRVADQIGRLAATLPQVLRRYAGTLEQYQLGRWILSRAPPWSETYAGLGSLLVSVSGFFSSALGIVVDGILVFVIGLYLAVQGESYREGMLRLLPAARRHRAREVLGVVDSTLRNWLVGKTVSMAALGVMAFIGLSLLKIPLALTLALITALLTFIPNFGAVLSVILPVLIALTQSPVQALYVLVFYAFMQHLEGYFITPMIMKRAIQLPPALLITAQVFMAYSFGLAGLALAAPLTAVALVLVKMLYVEDVLGETVDLPGHEGEEDP
jgi:predicted PurR-regulated permease PerM